LLKKILFNIEEKPIVDKGAIYKPALKLIGKTASSTPTASPSISKSQTIINKLSPPDSALNSSLNSALEKEKIAKAKKQADEKKKSNLELFKEELKRQF
jgi:hypothetical protein